MTNCYSPYGINTYFLGSFGGNNDSRCCSQELKFSSLNKHRNTATNDCPWQVSLAVLQLCAWLVVIRMNCPGLAWPWCPALPVSSATQTTLGQITHIISFMATKVHSGKHMTLMKRHFPGTGLVSKETKGTITTGANPVPPDCSFTSTISELRDQIRCRCVYRCWLCCAVLSCWSCVLLVKPCGLC